MVVETAILKSLEAVVGSLGMSIVSHNEVMHSLHYVVSGDSWTTVCHTLAHFWQFSVLVCHHFVDFVLLSLCELSHIIIFIIVVVTGFGHLHKTVALLWGDMGGLSDTSDALGGCLR